MHTRRRTRADEGEGGKQEDGPGPVSQQPSMRALAAQPFNPSRCSRWREPRLVSGVERCLRDLLMDWRIARYRQRRIHDEQSLLRHRDVLGAYRSDFYGHGAPSLPARPGRLRVCDGPATPRRGVLADP
jgi:hypothetical protein